MVSLEAIFLSTFILISQNLERVAKKIGLPMDDDPAVHILKMATHPEALVAQFE